MIRILLKIIAMFTLVFICSAQADEIQRIKTELNSVRGKLSDLSVVEGSVVEKIDAMDKEISLSNKLISALKNKAQNLETQIIALNDSLDEKNKEWDIHGARLLETLKCMYMIPDISEFELLLGDSTIAQISEDIVYLKVVAISRNIRIQRIQNLIIGLKNTKERLENVEDSLHNTINEMEEVIIAFESSKRTQNKKLKSIREKKSNYKKLLRELEKSQAQLEKLLKEQEIYGGKFIKLKGKLPCPLSGRCKIERSFGTYKDRMFGTIYNNSGVDFAAFRGEKVKAIAEGSIAHVSWLTGFQYVVIVQHDGGFYTVYGNLGDVYVIKGQLVDPGTVLGEIAGTDWLGESPKLHFEIRKGKHRENPALWLSKASL